MSGRGRGRLFEAVGAEFATAGVARFGQAVGVLDQDVAGAEVGGDRGQGRAELLAAEQAEGGAGLAELLGAGPGDEHGRVMASEHDFDAVGVGVEAAAYSGRTDHR